MDTTAVRGLLAGSLVPNTDDRRRAELQLKQVCSDSLRLVVSFFFCPPFPRVLLAPYRLFA